ncbi:MAG: hypothetical protein IJS58_05560 [Bacilli bacterium]|nr:hypothetical protein [Bacilli bacterium]
MKKILFIFLLSFFTFLFVGCHSEHNSGITKSSLRGGFSGGGEPASPIWLGFTSDKTMIREGDDLALKVYYGTILSYPNDFINLFEKDGVSPDEIQVVFLITYGRCSKDLLQKGEETYTKPEYIINLTRIGETIFKTIDEFGSNSYPMLGKNSQYDEIVLVSDLFNEKMGYISFVIKINGVFQGVIDENSTGGSATLYYKNDNGNIMLYDSYYKYSNSII